MTKEWRGGGKVTLVKRVVQGRDLRLRQVPVKWYEKPEPRCSLRHILISVLWHERIIPIIFEVRRDQLRRVVLPRPAVMLRRIFETWQQRCPPICWQCCHLRVAGRDASSKYLCAWVMGAMATPPAAVAPAIYKASSPLAVAGIDSRVEGQRTGHAKRFCQLCPTYVAIRPVIGCAPLVGKQKYKMLHGYFVITTNWYKGRGCTVRNRVGLLELRGYALQPKARLAAWGTSSLITRFPRLPGQVSATSPTTNTLLNLV